MKRIIGLLCLSQLLWTGCVQENGLSEPISSLTPVQFTAHSVAQIATRTTADGNEWSDNDEIGLFMQGAATASNCPYKVSDAESGALIPAGDDGVYYPATDGTVSFTACYPYKAGMTGNSYPVDVTNQSTPGNIDLLYSNNATGVHRDDQPVELEFSHALSKLTVTVRTSATVTSLEGLTVDIRGASAKGNFDVSTGAFNSLATKTFNAKVVDATTHTYEAILIPGSTSGSAVYFTIGHDSYSWFIPSKISTLVAGMHYNYTVTLHRSSVTVLDNGNSTWTIGQSDNVSTYQPLDISRSDLLAGNGWTYDPNTRVFTIANGASVCVEGESSSNVIVDPDNPEAIPISAYPNTIEIANGPHPTNVMLRNAKMECIRTARQAPCINVNEATLNLMLMGDSFLRGDPASPVIHVATGGKLTVDGTGTLDISNGDHGSDNSTPAIIGSRENEGTGTIIINGGTIFGTFSPYSQGAVIGTGVGGTGGTVIVNGGELGLLAFQGACIGGGYGDSTLDEIRITGGTFSGTSDTGACIGLGEGCHLTHPFSINISGGVVHAISEQSAGIGPGINNVGDGVGPGMMSICITGGITLCNSSSQTDGFYRGGLNSDYDYSFLFTGGKAISNGRNLEYTEE
ncbi:MAG: fimbrillin family protein [Mediterranea sp.]|jgi:hypothetical protein|nr:fimbrillin family protein [Mediterranea sp.]